MKNKSITAYFKETEFWVGLGTIAVIVFLISRLPIVQQTAKKLAQKATIAVPTQPQPISPRPTIAITATPTSAMIKPTGTSEKVNMLANTAGYLYHTVQEGENYFVISKKECGTGHYFLHLQAINNDMPLHAGDQVLVECTE